MLTTMEGKIRSRQCSILPCSLCLILQHFVYLFFLWIMECVCTCMLSGTTELSRVNSCLDVCPCEKDSVALASCDCLPPKIYIKVNKAIKLTNKEMNKLAFRNLTYNPRNQKRQKMWLWRELLVNLWNYTNVCFNKKKLHGASS